MTDSKNSQPEESPMSPADRYLEQELEEEQASMGEGQRRELADGRG